ncbi:hypothetical protein [Tenacibaculum xiamenense]|uniref:hypothetical protein n=1 Tax=Tenacibaculum xiamenense TaxID=1261553 RepID=UPI0038930100
MKEKNQENIERYIHNQMSDNDRNSFENEMKLDSELREEVQLQLNLHRVMSKQNELYDISPFNFNQEKDAVKELLKSEELKTTSEYIRKSTAAYKKRKKRFRFYKYAASIAATILLLITIKSTIYSGNINFYEEYADWNDLPSLVEKGANENSLITIEKLYNDKDYKAIVELKDGNTNDPYTLIYKGVASAQLNDIDSANRFFDLLINNDSLESSRGYWYKSLLLLKENKYEEAKKLLGFILKNKNNYNYNKAQEIYSKMK